MLLHIPSHTLYQHVLETKILRLSFDSEKIIEDFQQMNIPKEIIECLNRRTPEPFGMRVNEDDL